MYDELIKRLRETSIDFGELDDVSVMLLEAADAIEELSKPKWIPVTERLPSKGTNVLVYEFGRVEQAYITTCTADSSPCWVVINGYSYHRISDADCPIKWWMPLPQPPKEE